MLKTLLKFLMDFIFYSILVIVIVFLVSNVAELIKFELKTRQLLFAMAMTGPAISLILSAICYYVWQDIRYQWYVIISSLEMIGAIYLFLM